MHGPFAVVSRFSSFFHRNFFLHAKGTPVRHVCVWCDLQCPVRLLKSSPVRAFVRMFFGLQERCNAHCKRKSEKSAHLRSLWVFFLCLIFRKPNTPYCLHESPFVDPWVTAFTTVAICTPPFCIPIHYFRYECTHFLCWILPKKICATYVCLIFRVFVLALFPYLHCVKSLRMPLLLLLFRAPL